MKIRVSNCLQTYEKECLQMHVDMKIRVSQPMREEWGIDNMNYIQNKGNTEHHSLNIVTVNTIH